MGSNQEVMHPGETELSQEFVLDEKVDHAIKEYIEARDNVVPAIRRIKMHTDDLVRIQEVIETVDQRRRDAHNAAARALLDIGFAPKVLPDTPDAKLEDILKNARDVVDSFLPLYTNEMSKN